MTTKDLLVELLVEELPPKSLKKLEQSFAEILSGSLKDQGLTTSDSVVTAYATPRRLAVHISHVVAQAEDKSVSYKLMPVSVGLDQNGQATQALLKRLGALGENDSVVPQLKREMAGKSEMLFLDSIAKGATLVIVLQLALDKTITGLPIPKVMTYQLADGWQSVNFVRPVHRLVALYGAEVVPVSILGLTAGNVTQGHRFEAAVDPIVVQEANSYVQQLETEGAVIASFVQRRAQIDRQLAAVAASVSLKPIEDEALLDEVCALVELPNVLIGEFETEFLEVPQECLILTMKSNQKYFPLLDSNGKLTNKFLLVSNVRPEDTSLVIGGNERVVRSRLADAKFFFDQDRKKTLASRVPGLNKVVYHNKIGTQGFRIAYVRAIAIAIAHQLGGCELGEQADKAAELAKADLLTEMVGEFPTLQGIMGRYYALHEGMGDEVAFAIEDHYKPRFAGDELPRNQIGVCVALADKLETLISMFNIGEIPTGDKDPFALRRHALGIIRILIEKDLAIEINVLIKQIIQIIEDDSIRKQWIEKRETETKDSRETMTFTPGNRRVSEDVNEQLLAFIYERLAGSLREQGYSAQEIEAVLALRPQSLSDIPKRLVAVRDFSALPEASSLAAANKRVGNILKKASSVSINQAVNEVLLQEPAEQALFQALTGILPSTDESFKTGDYTACLQTLAALKLPIDTFFDDVMVNVNNEALRNNRLALLAQLQQAMNRVADISRLAG